MSFQDFWLVVRRRRTSLIVTTVVTAVLAVTAGLIRGDRYTASGEIQIQPGSSSGLKASISSVLTSGGIGTIDTVIESDVEILQSKELLLKVAESLKLLDNPDFLQGKKTVKTSTFLGQEIPLLHGNLSNPYVSEAVIKILRRNLKIGSVPRTQLISIEYKSRSPQLSADIVNALESEYIEDNFSSHYKTTQQVSKWLAGQIEDLRSVVQSSEGKMTDLQRKLGVYALDPEHSLIVQEVGSLEKGIADSTEARVSAEARYRILQSLPPDQIQDSPTPLGTDGQLSLLTSLRSQRATISSELAKLLPLYGKNYPQVKQLNAQIAALNREISEQETRVVNQANDAYRVASAAENNAKGMFDDRVKGLYGQRDDLVQYMLLTQEYESNRRMYESILSRLREAAVDAGLDAADIGIVDLALLPVEPSSPSPFLLAFGGLFLGALLGLIYAFLSEKLATHLRDAQEIQDILGLPPLAFIPQTKIMRGETGSAPVSSVIDLLRDSNSPFAESFRAFRTSLLLSSTSRQSKVIAITSCQPSEGKTVVSMNTAVALAQVGKKVVLLETDMRRPAIRNRFGLKGRHGLSEILTGLNTLEEVIQRHEKIGQLDIVPSGTVPPQPSELLASDQMGHLVEHLRANYDYVIFDCPPVLSVTDPVIVGSLADGIVVVIRQGLCTRRMLIRAAEILNSINVKIYGFVLNGIDATLPEYYGYAGYYTYKAEK
jgi:capsular exopolysaccharide synthesis family protein